MLFRLLFPLVVLLGSLNCAHLSQKTSIGHDFEILFYAAPVEVDIRYSIVVAGDSLFFRNHRRNSSRNVPNDYVLHLSQRQVRELDSLANQIPSRAVYQDDLIVAAWGVKLNVREHCVYKDQEYLRGRTSSPYKAFLHYVIGLLPFELDLYSFS